MASSLSSVVREFVKTPEAELPLEKLLPAFMRFARLAFTPDNVRRLEQNDLFAGGFSRSNPVVCFHSVKFADPDHCEALGLITSSRSLLEQSELCKLDRNTVAHRLGEWINSYRALDDHWKTIGGHTQVLLVRAVGSTWIRRPPALTVSSAADLKKAYVSGRLQLHPIPPFTKADLERHFGISSKIPVHN